MRDVRTRSEAKLNFNLSLIVRMMHEAFSHNRVASRRVSPRHVGSSNFTRTTTIHRRSMDSRVQLVRGSRGSAYATY